MKNKISLLFMGSILVSAFFMIQLNQISYGQVINRTTTFNEQEGKEKFIGVVINGTFLLAEDKQPRNLTTVQVAEASSPELGQINITEYEGKSILVATEQAGPTWFWGSEIIDIGTPIISELIKKVYEFQ
jgi:hypothetical protein